MTISTFLDKLLWGLMIGVASFGVSQVQSATQSIGELNQKMAVVITQLSDISEVKKDHENRIRALEKRK